MQVRHIISAFTCCALVGLSSAQTLVRSVPGPAAGSHFGKACIAIPDQNSDGVKDLLVGAPGFNSGRGAIYCASGAHLATGSGAQILWTLAPTANAGDNFGFALADVGDVTGDGVHDFLVGQPGHDAASTVDVGAIRLVHGSTHAIISLGAGVYAMGRLGSSLAACGDVNLNGYTDVAIGEPGGGAFDEGLVLVQEGLSLLQSGNVLSSALAWTSGSLFGDEHGASVASGGDLTGDGIQEIVIGAPGSDSGASGAGRVVVWDFVLNQRKTIDSFSVGERMGSAVSIAHDYDGDGVADIVVGAPNSPNGSAYEVGRAVVLSGARVVAQTPPYEIYSFAFGSVAPPVNHSDPQPNFHFGAAVKACDDLNNDGIGEIIVGAPGYFSPAFPSGWNFRGLVRVYSGATGVELSGIAGASTDRLGDGLGDAMDDLNGDGFKEFVLGGSLSDAGGTDSGVVKCYRLFPIQPWSYCAGKVNSLGCTPTIAFSGTASATSTAPFAITASNFLNQKIGLMFYSHRPSATLFQGGIKCVGDPVVRTPAHNSGGSASGSDCTGAHGLDFNARLQSGVDPTLTAGAEIHAQFWARDPQSLIPTSLSNALRFVIHP